MKTLKHITTLMATTALLLFTGCDADEVGDAINESVVIAALTNDRWYYEEVEEIDEYNCLQYAWTRFNEDNSTTEGNLNSENNCDDITVEENTGTWELISSEEFVITFENGYQEHHKILEITDSLLITEITLESGNTATVTYDHIPGPN